MYALTAKVDGNILVKKRIDNFFPTANFWSYETFNSQSLLNMLYNIFAHNISKPLDLDQMRIGQIRNNSVLKTF